MTAGAITRVGPFRRLRKSGTILRIPDDFVSFAERVPDWVEFRFFFAGKNGRHASTASGPWVVLPKSDEYRPDVAGRCVWNEGSSGLGCFWAGGW